MLQIAYSNVLDSLIDKSIHHGWDIHIYCMQLRLPKYRQIMAYSIRNKSMLAVTQNAMYCLISIIPYIN